MTRSTFFCSQTCILLQFSQASAHSAVLPWEKPDLNCCWCCVCLMQLASSLAVCCPPTLPPLSHRTDTSYASSVWDTAVPTLIKWPNNRLVGLNKTTYVHCFITVLCLESKYTHKLTPIMGSSLQIGDYKLCRFSLIFVYYVGYSFISMPNCGQIWGCSCDSRGTRLALPIFINNFEFTISPADGDFYFCTVYGC